MMKLNNINANAAWNIHLEKGGYDSLLNDLKAKQGYEFNWPDEDGMETDPLEDVKFERRTYGLPIVIFGQGKQDLVNNYSSFLTFIKNSKEIILETGLSAPLKFFKVRFSSLTAFKTVNMFTENGLIGCRFTLSFTDDYPLGYQPVPGDFIVDTDRNFDPTIVAMKGDSFRLEIELQDDSGGVLDLSGMSYSINVMSVALELPNVLVVTASSGYMAGLPTGEQPFVIKETKADSTIKTIINGILLVVE